MKKKDKSYIIILKNIKSKKKLDYIAQKLRKIHKKIADRDMKIKEAILLYNQKQYNQAKKILDPLLKLYPENEMINYYYGKIMYNLRNYERAYLYFDKILVKNPQNAKARLEMARVLVRLKSYDKAKAELKKALILPLPPVVRKNILSYLKKVESLQKNYTINGILLVGLGYNNNINNTTYTPFTDIGGLVIQNNTNKISDTYHREILSLNHLYKFDKKSIVKTSLTLYNQIQSKYSDKNIFLADLSSGPIYKIDNFLLSASAGVNKMWYGSEDYMHMFHLDTALKYTYRKNNIVNFTIKLKKKCYTLEQNKNRDSLTKSIGLAFTKIFSGKKIVNLSFNGSFERKSRGNLSDVDKDDFAASLSYSQDIIKLLNIKISTTYVKEKYKDVFPLFGQKRSDNNSAYSLIALKKFKKGRAISLKYSIIHNRSNIGVYSYDKRVATVSFVQRF